MFSFTGSDAEEAEDASDGAAEPGAPLAAWGSDGSEGEGGPPVAALMPDARRLQDLSEDDFSDADDEVDEERLAQLGAQLRYILDLGGAWRLGWRRGLAGWFWLRTHVSLYSSSSSLDDPPAAAAG